MTNFVRYPRRLIMELIITTMVSVNILVWAVILALVVAFIGSLLIKWGIIHTLQLHAPSDLLHELFSCRFCMSWWISIFISIWPIVNNGWEYLLVPVCATIIASRLW